MKITSVGRQCDLRTAFGISRGSKTAIRTLEVQVESDGLIGLGESTPYPRYSETVESCIAQLDSLPRKSGQSELLELLPSGSAKTALDLALLDLRAKKNGTPVWELLELPMPSPLPFGETISLKSTEEMVKEAKEKSDCSILKIKLGGRDDMSALEGIRQQAPESRIRVDVNEGWSFEELVDYLPKMTELNIELIEQPITEAEDERLIELQSPIPLCADESLSPNTKLESLREKYQVINFKLDKSGGLTNMVSQIRRAQEMGFGIMVGCMVSSSLAIAPAFYAAQLADYIDLDGFTHLAQDREQGMQIIDGYINADAVGWGKP